MRSTSGRTPHTRMTLPRIDTNLPIRSAFRFANGVSGRTLMNLGMIGRSRAVAFSCGWCSCRLRRENSACSVSPGCPEQPRTRPRHASVVDAFARSTSWNPCRLGGSTSQKRAKSNVTCTARSKSYLSRRLRPASDWKKPRNRRVACVHSDSRLNASKGKYRFQLDARDASEAWSMQVASRGAVSARAQRHAARGAQWQASARAAVREQVLRLANLKSGRTLDDFPARPDRALRALRRARGPVHHASARVLQPRRRGQGPGHEPEVRSADARGPRRRGADRAGAPTRVPRLGHRGRGGRLGGGRVCRCERGLGR
jgi:hypothetical protein